MVLKLFGIITLSNAVRDHHYPYAIHFRLPVCEVKGKKNIGMLNFNAFYM